MLCDFTDLCPKQLDSVADQTISEMELTRVLGLEGYGRVLGFEDLPWGVH